MSETILIFLVVLVTSFFFTIMLAQIPLLRIPSAVSYLVFGILLQSGPIHLPSDERHWIGHLGDVGLLFLMFISGLEVEVRSLKPSKTTTHGSNPLLSATQVFVGTLLCSFAAAWIISALAPGHVQPYMITLLLSTTSLGVIVPVLAERDMLQNVYGQTLLLCALLADVVTMLLVSLYVSRQTSGDAYQFVLSLVIIPAACVMYFAVRWLQKRSWRDRIASDATARLRGVIAMVAAGCALADYTGSEPILGSFLVGVVVAATPMAFAKEIRAYCHGIGYGLLVPVFFLSVGLNFRMGAFMSPKVWTWTAVLITAAILVKLIPALYLKRQFGQQMSVAAGILLSTRLSLVVAAADIAVQIGSLPPYLGDAFTLTAVVTCLWSPILFLALTPRRPAVNPP